LSQPVTPQALLGAKRSTALADKVFEELAACIGCNDCMLACPLAEAKSVTIAELNAAVHESEIANPNVVGFVTACTQCRQCVPACPADLSRADMVLFNKHKVEDAVTDHPLSVQVGDRVMAAPWTLDTLTARLSELPLFHGVPQESVRRMLLSVTLRHMNAGELLCPAGAFHERLVIVLYGGLEQFSTTHDGRNVSIVGYGPGSFLGEMGVLADQPEPFGIRALARGGVMEIPKASVVRLMEQAPEFKSTMLDLYRRRALYHYALSPGALGTLPESVVRELLEAAELLLFKDGDVIYREGEATHSFYLVRSGFVRASRQTPEGDRTLVYFREGDPFGVSRLLLNEPQHAYTAQAATRAEVIRVPAAALLGVFQRDPRARELLARALEAEHVARSPALGVAPRKSAATFAMPLSLDVFFEQGLASGREVLVVDQTKCTYCQNCIDACARRHGEPRLELRGLQVEHLLFPTACRHCEDPVCLLCAVNGIVRRPSGEISIVEDNCIGCGACAERCPYGNISMHPVAPPRAGVLGSVAEFLGFRRREGRASDTDPEAAQKAVKCDLCADYADYACVTACPTGAAFRTQPGAAFSAGARSPGTRPG
jgi:Fe-S-cluster-containing hydrogenase component 2/CRP-like cAMP-binding protein